MDADVYWEYGTLPGHYIKNSETYSITKDLPLEVDFVDLISNTKYYYRARHSVFTVSFYR